MKTRKIKKPSNQSIGALFVNRSRSHPRSPDLCGLVELSSEFIEELITEYDRSEQVNLDLSAWKNQAQTTGQSYLTLKLKVVPQLRKKRRSDEDEEIESLLQFMAEEDSE